MRRARADVGEPSIWVGRRRMPDVFEGFMSIGQVLRWNALFLALWIGVWSAGGYAYAKMVPSEYVATTQVLLRPRQIVNDGPEDIRHFHQFLIDSEQCETELRVLRSQQLLYPVMAALDLENAPEIKRGSSGLTSYFARQLSPTEVDQTVTTESIEAFYAFADRVRARRLGLSYIIEISYRAHSGEQAAKVANAIAVGYVAHRLRGVIARDSRRGVYLERRATTLTEQFMAAGAGMRLGIIPDSAMPDADVRVLGAASVPQARSYPKTAPLMLATASLGTVSGLLLVLLSQGMRFSRRTSDGEAKLSFSAARPTRAG